MTERIAKFLAHAGVCSRRDAERLIAEGRVRVNGTVLDSPATKVGPDDTITVDDAPIHGQAETRLFRYHKPAGLVTTHRDEKNRSTVFDQLPRSLPRVVSVGRLDLNSEGLLLLTTDGGLARLMELPATGLPRTYRVRVHGRPNAQDCAQLAEGMVVDGVHYQGIEAVLDHQSGANAWLTLTLREGKNREIRVLMEALGYPVNRLIRTGYGPFALGDLVPGEVAEIPHNALQRFLKTVGLRA